MEREKILYVEDDPNHMKQTLTIMGVNWDDPANAGVSFPLAESATVATQDLDIVLASNLQDGLAALQNDPDFLCVVADMRLPDRPLGRMQNEGGRTLFRFMLDHGLVPNTQFVLITAYGTDETGRTLFEEGIYDYFSKGDFVDPGLRDGLRRIVRRAIEKAKLFRRTQLVQRSNVRMRQDAVEDTILLCTRLDEQTLTSRNRWRQTVLERMDERTADYVRTLEEKGEFAFVGRSAAVLDPFMNLIDLAERQGDRPGLNVLIHGAAGVGKSAFALLMHLLSPRSQRFDFICDRIVQSYQQLLNLGNGLGYNCQKELASVLENEFPLIPRPHWSRNDLPEEAAAVWKRVLERHFVRQDAVSKQLHELAAHAHACWRDVPKFNYRVVPGASWVGETAITDLFGSRKGAYTGAESTRPGDFQVVSNVGGTLCIDDIDCLHHSAQMLFLNAIEKPFEVGRKGSTVREKVDVMLIATTNKYPLLLEKFDKGFVRRLGYHNLEIPPLDQRREDIPLLVLHYLLEHAKRYGYRYETIDADALQFLTRGMEWEYHAASVENFIGDFCAWRAKQDTKNRITRQEIVEFAGRKQAAVSFSPPIPVDRDRPSGIQEVPAGTAVFALPPLPPDGDVADFFRIKGRPESVRGLSLPQVRRMLVRLLVEEADFQAIRKRFRVHPITLAKIYEGDASCDNRLFSPPEQNAFAVIAEDLVRARFHLPSVVEAWGFESSKPLQRFLKKSIFYIPREGRKRGEVSHGHRLLFQFARLVRSGGVEEKAIVEFLDIMELGTLKKQWKDLLGAKREGHTQRVDEYN